MKQFPALCFCLLFLVQEAACFIREHKVTELSVKFGTQSATSLYTTSPQKNGRVFYPAEYGADPTGEEDSSDAILQALSSATQVESRLELLHGIKDLGGVVLDFQGGNYTISKPIRFPAGVGNILVQRGTLRAQTQFPGDGHLVELWSPNSQKHDKKSSLNKSTIYDTKYQNVRIYYEDITFRDILFDSSYQGGGIFVVDSARIRINNCFFLHFTTEGILVQGGHETFISGTFLGQHSTVGGDPGEKYFSGTAIDLSSNDNAITDVAIFSAGVGIQLRGQANIITGVHCYNKATYWGGIGIHVVAGAALTRIDSCYLDYNGIVLEDPVQVHVTNGLFLGEGNVVLKSINGKVLGLNIVENMFNGNPSNMKPIIVLRGEFSDIDQVVIDRNNAQGMSMKSSVGKLTVPGNGTKWVANFSSLLVFPNRINHFEYSFFLQDQRNTGLTAHAVTNIFNNVVVVESEKEMKGTLSILVDQ